MPVPILIELHFLPCIDYFISLIDAGEVILDIDEPYQKQSYRNRAYLLGANNVIVCTVPVSHQPGNKPFTKDVRIDYSQQWLPAFLRSVKSCYGKSPYFEHYYGYFEKVFLKKHEYIWDLNRELLTVCLYLLDLGNLLVIKDKKYDNSQLPNKNLKNCINPKKIPYNKDILTQLSYKQTFGKDFVNNLSIMDLLFSEGNYASSLLQRAINTANK